MVEALINSDSEVNTINRNLMKKLSLQIYKTRIGAQKIKGLKLDTFRIVITSFSMKNQKKVPDFLRRYFY